MRASPAILISTLWLGGCGAKAPRPPPVPDAARAPAPPKTQASHGQPEEDEPIVPRENESPEWAAQRARLIPLASQIDQVMRAYQGCVAGIYEAGHDRKGQALLVVEWQAGDCLVPAPPTPFGAGRLDRQRAPRAHRPQKPAGDEEPEECERTRYFLVTRQGARVRPVALLAEACIPGEDSPIFKMQDLYGAEVDKENKVFTESRSWGGGQRGSGHVAVGLDPLRIVSTGHEKGMADNDDQGTQTWNWDEFAGTASWPAVDCKEKARLEAANHPAGDASAAGGGHGDETIWPAHRIEAVLIPWVPLPDDFVAQGWRTTRLGQCSALVEPGVSGHVLHGGSEGPPGDATLRALFTGGSERPETLLVEISDDRFVGPGRSWVTDDHLELWIGDATVGNERVCGPEGQEWIAQWGIRVADGAVFPAHGAPPPLVGVERVLAGRTARFKIPLPQRGSRYTVVYSDSDDGRRQERLIGTSQLRFGDPATLGEPWSAGDACIAKRGALQPRRDRLEPSLTDPAAGRW